MQMSSAQVAILGIRSENSIPHAPCLEKTRGVAMILAIFLKLSVSEPCIDSGTDWPFHFFKAGLFSNRSSWLGPPDMNSQMTLLALGAKCGGLGARGFSSIADSARPPPLIRFLSAIMPTPSA